MFPVKNTDRNSLSSKQKLRLLPKIKTLGSKIFKPALLKGHNVCGYKFGLCVGEGGCAFVYQVFKRCNHGSRLSKNDNIEYGKFAAKVSKRPITHQSLEERQSWFSEAAILSALSHNNIIQVVEFSHVKGHAMLITEYVDGEDLFSLISRSSSIPVGSRSIVCQLFEVLDYLHNIQSIAHMDLKVENVLLHLSGTIKLCDFGSAVQIPPGGKIQTGGITTPSILPPEYLLDDMCDPTVCDVWSVGIIMYLLLVQKYPFGAGVDFGISIEEYKQTLDFTGINTKLFKYMIQLTRCCLQLNPKRRIRVKDALMSDFFKLKS